MIQYETQSPPTTATEAWARVGLRWGLTPWQMTKIQAYTDRSVMANQIRGEVKRLLKQNKLGEYADGHS